MIIRYTKNNIDVKYNSLDKNKYIEIASITNQQIQFSRIFLATIYVVTIAPQDVNASKNGIAAFVYFVRIKPVNIESIITEVIIMKCCILLQVRILLFELI